MTRLRREISVPWPRRDSALALLGLTILVVWLLREAVFGGRVFFLRDVHLQWYGQIESFVGSVASGSWPFWDPYVSFGQPLLANANAQVLYPLTWLNMLVRPWTYFTIYLVTHLLLAGAGVYALGRQYEISRLGSFLAAAAWMLSGPVLSLGNLWNHLAAAAWLPWVLLAAERALISSRPRHAVLCGATLAAQILAGSPDVVVMTSLLLAAAAARHVRWRRLGERSSLEGVAALVLAVGFGLALSAGQLLPSLELAMRAGRFHLSAAERGYWSVHPLGLLQAAVPVFWNDLPLGAEQRQALFESREPLLLSLYLGLPVVGLMLAALAVPRRPGRSFLLLGAFVAALLALGPHAPFYRLATALLPTLQVLRFPSKAMIVVAFAGALLAGMGADAWREGGGRPGAGRRWFLFVTLPMLTCALLLALTAFGALGGMALLAPVAGKLARAAVLAGILAVIALLRRPGPRSRWGAVAVGVLAVTDLLTTHRHLNATSPKELYTLRPGVLEPAAQADHRRLYVVDYQADLGLSERWLKRAVPYVVTLTRTEPGLPPPLWTGALGMRVYPVAPVAAAWRVPGSYSRDVLRIQPPGLATLNALLIRALGTPLQIRLLRLGAVSRVLALHTEGFEDFAPIATLEGPFLEPIRVFGVPDPLPRAYAVDGVRVASGRQALEHLVDPSFDPAREVVVAEGTARNAEKAFSAVVSILALRSDRVRLQAELGKDGYAILVDAYDPGWRATVDGHAAPVLSANLAFRAIPVPAGRHVVEMVYRPVSVTIGLTVSAVAAALGVAMALRRQTTPSTREAALDRRSTAS